MIPLTQHLWQSTLFAAAAALLTLALRKNRAQTRYWIWLAASIKFLLPFSLLVGLGSQVEWRTPPPAAVQFSAAVETITKPFVIESIPQASSAVPTLLFLVWATGCATVLFYWWKRWRGLNQASRAATTLDLGAPIRTMSSPTLIEPGVFGIFRPILLLPEGITGNLAPSQLRAVLAHELCHVRRRDNLTAAIHMLVEAIFWFHPLVWWIGARLVDERERACDEEVLRLGNQPEAYAEGILNVCRFYLKSPLACAPGVTGADLKKRIEAIMTLRLSQKLTPARKLLLAGAGLLAVAAPVFIGVVRAQAKPDTLTFEVASIKLAAPGATATGFRFLPGGGLQISNEPLKELIAFAYDVRDFQISGGPAWLNTIPYDILAKPEAAQGPDKQRDVINREIRERLRSLLVERFQLSIHKETKELPVYGLVVAKNGPKMEESKEGEGSRQNIFRRVDNGKNVLTAKRVSIQMLVSPLSHFLGGPVRDQTGLKGSYDLKMEWALDLSDTSGPSLFTAIQEQLGLRLDSQKGPVEIIVIDRAEKPSEN